MKKLLCIFISILMIVLPLALVGCGDDDNQTVTTLKFGMATVTDVSKASDAETDVDGQGKATITVAAVLIDSDGKVVKCQLDTAENTIKYTADGKAIANSEFKTKYEYGTDYNMKTDGGAAKEWYEQADSFENVVVGKTLNEIKSLVADGNKGTTEVITAGCTIMINDFVNAIEKAISVATDSNATANDSLKLGVYTEQTCKDALDEIDGQSKLETTIFATAIDSNGKIVAASSDCVQVIFTFDSNGASTYDLSKPIVSKRDAGDGYGMKTYDNAAKEWYEQAAAFDANCIGKTITGVSALMGQDNYGNTDVKAAGCTILINGFVKAAEKIK